MEWLETFLVAAEEENFHRAADRLHLSQPAVTLQIQKVEHELGERLFERVGRHVVLTNHGRRLRPYVHTMLEALAEGREALARWQQGYEVTVTLAVSPLVATTYLPRWMRTYQGGQSRVEFSVQVTESSEILQQIVNRDVDVGFSRLQVQHPHVDCTMLYDDPVILVAPNDDGDLDGPMISAADLLTTYPIFTHNHPEYWDDLSRQIRRAYPAARTMKISQVHVSVQFVAERMGVSFLPESTVRRELLRGVLREVACDPLTLPTARTTMILHRAANAHARHFADHVLKYMRDRPI